MATLLKSTWWNIQLKPNSIIFALRYGFDDGFYNNIWKFQCCPFIGENMRNLLIFSIKRDPIECNEGEYLSSNVSRVITFL